MSKAIHEIRDVFGGLRPFAKAIGKTPSTVQHWLATSALPRKNRSAVIDAMKRHGVGDPDGLVDLAIAGMDVDPAHLKLGGDASG